jgi:molybdenum cofactor cytidylyltransferase
MTPAIVLAAGLSSRMGEPKALLPVGPNRSGCTFLRQIVERLLDGGASDALVVGRPDDARLRHEIDSIAQVRFVANDHADTGQLSSVIAGLNAADRPGVRAVLITPVDMPYFKSATIRTLIDAAASSQAPIVRPRHAGRHGHPVIFGRAVFDALRRADPATGARAVVRAHRQDALDVDVDDPGVLHDIDLPEDYERAIDELR